MSHRTNIKSHDDFMELVDSEQRWDVSVLLDFLQGHRDRRVLCDWLTPDGARMISFEYDESPYVAAVGPDGSVDVESSENFIDRLTYSLETPSHFMAFSDFSEEFWSWPAPLFHGTSRSNLRSILKNGLHMESLSRGLSNRHTGHAVFTSLDPEHCLDYGSAVVEIATKDMKRDGVMPFVSQELPIAEAEQLRSLAWRVGLEEYEVDIESGLSPDTVVVYGDIPAKYLSVQGEQRNPRQRSSSHAA